MLTRSAPVPATKNVNTATNGKAWMLRLRLGGGGGEAFCPLYPTQVYERPVQMTVLRLTESGVKCNFLPKGMPSSWCDVNLKLSPSREFASGTSFRGLLHTEWEDTIRREELAIATDGRCPNKFHIKHEMKAFTQKNVRCTVEYEFLRTHSEWQLHDVEITAVRTAA
jgi:hypothetical protein